MKKILAAILLITAFPAHADRRLELKKEACDAIGAMVVAASEVKETGISLAETKDFVSMTLLKAGSSDNDIDKIEGFVFPALDKMWAADTLDVRTIRSIRGQAISSCMKELKI